MSSRFLLFAHFILVSAVGTAWSAPVRQLDGVPFVFEHRWGEDEAGLEYSQWTGALGLWRSETRETADGEFGTRWWIAPLASRSENFRGYDEWSVLWPLPLLQRRDWTNEERSRWIAAFWLWHWERHSANHLSWLLFPLLDYNSWASETGQRSNRLSALGGALYNRVTWDDASAEAHGVEHLLPLYRRDWSTDESWGFHAPSIPLVGFGRDPARERRYDYVFPYWRLRDDETGSPDGQRLDAILPLWLRQDRVSNDGARVESDHWIFPYLRSREQWEGASFGDDGTEAGTEEIRRALDLVLPWYHAREDRRLESGAWERVESDSAVLPVAWGRQGDELEYLHLLPLIYWWSDSRFVGFPFVWAGENHFLMLPIYGEWSSGLRRSQLFLFPLWYKRERMDSSGELAERHSRALWPFAGWGSEQLSRYSWAFPLWIHHDTEWGDGAHHSSVRSYPILLWYRHVRNEDKPSGDSMTVVFPIWWDNREWDNGEQTAHRRVIFPLWWDFDEIENGRRQQGLLPLWFSDRKDDELVGLSLLWPLIQMDWNRDASEHDAEPIFDLDILGFVGGAERWADGDHVVSLLGGPLWIDDHEENSRRRVLLGGLWGMEESEEERRLRLFWIPIRLR